jgi:energy-coupling factor transport system ATP-binding protein
MNAAVLNIASLSYSYPGSTETALSDISCSVRRGECVCLTGDSGCGKTTLLLAVKGLLNGGSLLGTVEISARPGNSPWSTPAGLVFQSAESQLLCTTVAEEVAFGPENLCTPPVEIGIRVGKALRAVGLEGTETRHVERFSAGQKQRLAIASVLSMTPSLLLLDEPTSQLDSQGKQELASLLASLKQHGHTIVMAEHDPRPFSAIIDRYLPMAGGRIGADVAILPDPDRYSTGSPAVPSSMGKTSTAAVIKVHNLSHSYPETGATLKQLSLQLLHGERLHLYGCNGAGKSTLLRCLAGLQRCDSGTVEIAGIASPRPEQLPGKVGVLFQNPARQLCADSVFEEVAFSLRRLGNSKSETDRVVRETLNLCGVWALADRAPLTLSFGEQHRVALAAVIASRPEVLLLDEPFAGLDFPQRKNLLKILAEISQQFGTAILIVSHDELPDINWADRRLQLQGGALVQNA